jgi:SAM-dependent methyltransferase
MNIFTSDEDSHRHSLQTLNLIANYDDFMDSIDAVLDLGCGIGNDTAWWANKTYINENNVVQYYDYRCTGVDLDISRAIHAHNRHNLNFVKADIETYTHNELVDLIWSHDSFRYVTNPLQTLKHWNTMLNENGMLALVVPQTINITYNKPVVRTLPGNYFHYTITNLMYMLAVNGFDCKDGHFVKYPNDPWLHCVVYKSEHKPLNPKTTSWYNLSELGLLPKTADDIIFAYGMLKQEGLQTHWLDGQFCDWSKV